MSSEPKWKTSPPPARTRRLGRGLASLMANTRESLDPIAPPASAEPVAASVGRYEPVAPSAPAAPAGPARISVDAIEANPYQPRRSFDDGELAELAQSIRVQGVLQPLLVVEQQEGAYVLVAGERRLRAARLAGLTDVPCVVRTATREQMLQWALIENIQRSDLNVVDRAMAYRDYIDRFAATQQQLAEMLGIPRSTIANHLRLLDLGDPVQSLLADGSLSFGHGKVLAALAGRVAEQTQLAKRVIAVGLSVRHLEQLVAAAINGDGSTVDLDTSTSAKATKSEYVQDVERQLSRSIGTKVSIRQGRSKKRGRVVVEYYSLDDFDRIVEALGGRIES